MTTIEMIKLELRESKAPFFTDDEIVYYLEKNDGNVRATIYEMLIIKSEDTAIQVYGWKTQDTSKYFKRLAARFKSFNSGVLK
jgi:hypothetical protein